MFTSITEITAQLLSLSYVYLISSDDGSIIRIFVSWLCSLNGSRFNHYFIFISFPLMYGLLGLDNIWLRYNYLKIWNLRVQKNLNIEKIAFKVVQMKFFVMHITKQK